MYANKTILRCALIGDGFSVVNGTILASIWGVIAEGEWRGISWEFYGIKLSGM